MVVGKIMEKVDFVVIFGCIEYGGKVKKGIFCKIVCNNLFRRKLDISLNRNKLKKFMEMDGRIGLYDG